MTFEVFDPRFRLPNCNRLRGMNLIGVDLRNWKSGSEPSMVSAVCKACFEDAYVERLMFGNLRMNDKFFFDEMNRYSNMMGDPLTASQAVMPAPKKIQELELKHESIVEVDANLWLEREYELYKVADMISSKCRQAFRAPINVFFIKQSYKDQVDKIVESLEHTYLMTVLKHGVSNVNPITDWEFDKGINTLTYTGSTNGTGSSVNQLYNYLKSIV